MSRLSRGTKTLGSRDGKQTVVIDGLSTLRQVAEDIRSDEDLKAQTNKLRVMHNRGGREGPYKGAKLAMPAIVPAMQAAKGTLLKGLPVGDYHNGLYGYDIDEHREALDLAAVREALIAAPGAVLVGASCAGDALFAIILGPPTATGAEYKKNWRAIAAGLPETAKANNGKASTNFNRLRFLAHDPDVWLAEGLVTPVAGAQTLEEPPTPTAPPDTPAATPGFLDAADVVRDAWCYIPPPQYYNQWLGWLGTFKALEFTVDEVEKWSSAGAKYETGEVAAKWDGLPDDDPGDARGRLRGAAYKLGWRPGGRPQPPSGSYSPPASTAVSDEAEVRRPYENLRMDSSNEWFAYADWWWRHHGQGRYRYVTDPASVGWWSYKGNIWRPLSTKDHSLHDELALYRYRFAYELVQQGHSTLAPALVQGGRFASAVSKGEKGDLWVALRSCCAGPVPEPERYYIGTPSGIIGLRDGSIRPHSPEYGIRALTTGDFLPGLVDQHTGALRARFDRVFDEKTQNDFIRLVALSLTGEAQAHRAVTLILGKSGSGKGDAANVVSRALGDLSLGVGNEWIAQQQRTEIDAVAAEILERQTRALMVDEIGGDTSIGVSRLNRLTGNASWSNRRPHGPLLRGSPVFMMWATAESVPSLPKKAGMERRLAVLGTKGVLEDREKDEEGGKAPDLLNAVVTLSCMMAAEVYKRPYYPPKGTEQARAEALADMDRVAD